MNALSQRSHEPSILAQVTAPVARALLEFQNKVAKALGLKNANTASMAVGGTGLVMMGTSMAASSILGPAGAALYGVGWLFTTGAAVDFGTNYALGKVAKMDDKWKP